MNERFLTIFVYFFFRKDVYVCSFFILEIKLYRIKKKEKKRKTHLISLRTYPICV